MVSTISRLTCKSCTTKSGLKDEGIMFLLTEGQITNEKFLVFINDLLSSGEIADLFANEDKDGIVNGIRPAVKSAGILDSRDNCWNYYIQRVRKNLHMCLCFSPVGDGFRNKPGSSPHSLTALSSIGSSHGPKMHSSVSPTSSWPMSRCSLRKSETQLSSSCPSHSRLSMNSLQ